MLHIKASKHACVTDLFVETAGSGVHDELVVKINESLSSALGFRAVANRWLNTLMSDVS
jgi:hypothetical protein